MAAFNRMRKFFSGEESIEKELPEEGYVEVNVMDSMETSETESSTNSTSTTPMTWMRS